MVPESSNSCENCARLRQRVADLERELQAAYDAASEAEYEYCGKLDQQRRELDQSRRAAREAQDDAYFREDEAKRLERAHERGDSVEVERSIGRLKRGW